MTIDTIVAITIPVLSVVLSLIGAGINHMLKRISRLEEKQDAFVDEFEIRQVITDKIEPLKEDMLELKDKINKLIDHWIDHARK